MQNQKCESNKYNKKLENWNYKDFFLTQVVQLTKGKKMKKLVHSWNFGYNFVLTVELQDSLSP